MTTRTAIITLQLRPERGVDPHKATRALLKQALRQHGLRAVAVQMDEGLAPVVKTGDAATQEGNAPEVTR